MAPLQCNGCKQQFLGAHTLSQHRDGDTYGSSTFRCLHPGCSTAFCNRRSLREHQEKEDHLEPRIQCNKCTQKFWRSGDLAKHVSEMHGSQVTTSQPGPISRHRRGSSIRSARSLQCSHCVREFPNSFTLSSHIQEQHASIHSPASTSFTPSSADSSTPPTPITPSPSRSTVCNGCHNNFWNLKALASHRDGEADPDVKFLCDFRGCGHIACSATLLKGHQDQNKHIINPGPYPPKPPNSVGPNKTTETRVVYVRCEECSQRLRVEDVSKHMDEYHPAFQCTGCEEVFDTSDGLSKHLDSGSLLKEELIVTCPCGAKFSGYAAAHQHIRENAAQPNHLFCFECGLSFETLGDYLCHNDRHHGYRHPPSFPIEAFPNKPEQRYARRLPTSSSSNQNAGCEKVGEKKQAAPIVYF